MIQWEGIVARFEELAPNSGVDTKKADDAWVIVPHGGANQVLLREGKGWQVQTKSDGGLVNWTDVPRPPHSRDPDNLVASATRGLNDRLLKVTARKKGMGKILVTNERRAIKIGFSVHPKTTHKIAFFFLQDKGATNAVRTQFTAKHAAEWVKDLNVVFGTQANLWFELAKADPLPLAGLPEIVSADEAPALAAAKDVAPINVFLAGKKIRSTEKSYPYGFYVVKEDVIVMRDQEPSETNARPMLKTLAHEIAHLLNHHRKAPTPGHDYYEKCGYNSDVLNTMDGNDIKIPHQRVLDWNPW